MVNERFFALSSAKEAEMTVERFVVLRRGGMLVVTEFNFERTGVS